MVHVASAFIVANHAVWAQSAFELPSAKGCLHLDLLVDLDAEGSEYSDVVLLEAKRIEPGKVKEKAQQIIGDYNRIRSWGQSIVGGDTPLFFELPRQLRRRYGGLVVVLRECCDRGGVISEPNFSTWWKELTSIPAVYPSDLAATLAKSLRSAIERGVEYGPYWDGGRRLVVLYAVFDFGRPDK